MTSPISKEKSLEFGSTSLSGVFSVEWVKKANIPFQEAHHLVNPWNDHKKVQISRDGQELEPKIGEELCKLWDAENSSQGGRTPRASNNINRWGNPSVQSDPHPTPSQWQSSQPNLGFNAMQQVYTGNTHPSQSCTDSISSTHHPCPLSWSSSGDTTAHGSPYKSKCSL